VCLLRGWLYLLYVDDGRTSQEARLCACYGDSLTFLCRLGGPGRTLLLLSGYALETGRHGFALPDQALKCPADVCGTRVD
jgi:hypothetical protein